MPCLECQKEGTKKKHEAIKNEKAMQPKKTTKGIPRKFNLEFVQKYMEDRGCKLLSDTYTTDRIKLRFVCICGREAEQNFNRFYHSNNRCNNQDCIRKRMETSLQKTYGVSNAMYSDTVKEKLAQTNIEKYGVQNVFASEEIKSKIWESNKRKYGVEYAVQSTEVKERIKQTNKDKYGHQNPFGSTKIQEKIKKNNMKKYGVEWPGQREDVKQKIQNLFVEKYGSRCPMQDPAIQEKIKRDCFDKYGLEYHASRCDVNEKKRKTTFDKYGVESVLSLPEFHAHGNKKIKEKIESTIFERYGTFHHMQNPDVAQKALNSSMKSKPFELPSRKIVKIQGFEDIVLVKLLNEHDENDIFTKRTDMPEVWYIDDNGKYHRYYPDFYIPSKNLVIEVKSIYTYKQDTKTYHKKRKACLYAGFRFENYIYESRKHERVHMHI
jgi:hypothetical protein